MFVGVCDFPGGYAFRLPDTAGSNDGGGRSQETPEPQAPTYTSWVRADSRIWNPNGSASRSALGIGDHFPSHGRAHGRLAHCERVFDWHRRRTLRILLGNASMETSSQGSRERRESPEAGKVVSRPEVKTLLSAGRNDPAWGSNAPPAGPRHRA